MKKVSLLAALAVFAGFTACQQEIVPETKTTNDTFVFSSVKPALENEVATKTEWNGETITWSKDDQIRMAYTVAGVWQGASDDKPAPKLYASGKLAEATEIAEFTVNSNFTSTATGEHIFYGINPGTITASSFDNAPKASITLPAEQTPAANSFDSAADLMVGVSEPYDQKPSTDETVLMTWTRLVAHADLTIKNLFILDGETISNVTFTAQEGADLVGLHKVDITTGEVSEPQGFTNEIVVKADNLVYENNTVKVWLSMLPETITDLTVTVETDKAYYTRSFNGITREFKKNMHNTMNIGMTSAVRTPKAANLVTYEESFNNTLGDFTIEKEVLSSGITYVWKENSGYAKGSAYNKKAYQATSYLVSPELTIGSNNSKLTFDHAANYLSGPFGDFFSVVVFDGEAENVLDLDVTPDGGSWTFVSSTVSLSAYNGKTIKIGFKYTSTSSVAGTWEVKNFKVTDVKVAAPAGLEYAANDQEFEIELNSDEYNNFTAPTLINPNNLEVVYSSSNTDVAFVDEDGAVVLGDAGTAVITATFAGNDDYQAGSASYTITIVDPDTPTVTGWVKTDLASIAAGDIFVIVGNNGDNYAMSNDKAASAAPTAVKVTVANDKITSNVADNIKWTLTVSDNKYVFHPNGSTTEWLYCTNTNNGVRVGNNSNDTFEVKDGYLYHSGTSRYVGIYQSQDWRCYTSINANITGQSFTFYKYFGNGGATPTTETYSVTVSETTNGTVVATPASEIEEGEDVVLTITPASNYELETLIVDGNSVNVTSITNSYTFTMPAHDVTVSATFAEGEGGETSVVYDFTGEDWTVSNGTLSNGTVSFTGEGTANFKMNAGYFFMGKSGAFIKFPSYTAPVTKIVVVGKSGASPSVKQNIFVGDNAVSTETTGATGTNTYDIASGYQTAGTVYTLKVTSAHNTQITKIEVFFASSN